MPAIVLTGVPLGFRGGSVGFRGGSVGFRGGSAWPQVKDRVWFVLCFHEFSQSNGGGSVLGLRHWAEPPFGAEQPPFKIKKGEISLGDGCSSVRAWGAQRVTVACSRILWCARQLT